MGVAIFIDDQKPQGQKCPHCGMDIGPDDESAEGEAETSATGTEPPDAQQIAQQAYSRLAQEEKS